MVNTITCPKCKQEFPLSEGVTHDFEERITASLSEKHKKELIEARQREREHVHKEVVERYMTTLQDLQKQVAEKDEKVAEYRDHELKLREEKRKLEEEKREVELTVARRMEEERKKADEEARRTVADEYRLREREKDMVIEGLRKSLEEAQRKANPTSQQLQGEALELDVAHILRCAFPQDGIDEIAKGQNGSDLLQTVKSPVQAVTCGKILWECKRTKTWNNDYLAKMKEDKIQAKADIGVIVSATLPKEASNGMGFLQGIWVISIALVECVAIIHRNALIDVARQKSISTHREGKADVLFSYITSVAFVQQIQKQVDAYLVMRTQIEQERKAYEKILSGREVQLNKLVQSTAKIYGTMQGILAESMPQIKGFDVLEIESGNA